MSATNGGAAAPRFELLAFDPWGREQDNTIPVGQQTIVTVEMSCFVDEYEVTLILDHDAPDRWHIWERTEVWGAPDELKRLLTFRTGTWELETGTLEEIVAELLYARRDLLFPRRFLHPGLLDEGQWQALIERVEERHERECAAAKERARTIPSLLIRVAGELGLYPEPTGEDEHSWHASCPGGNHELMIGTHDESWGCGYHKRKGGIKELRAFVAACRSRKQGRRKRAEEPSNP